VLKDVVRGRDRGRPSERADKARREARRCLYSGGLRGNQCGLHRQDNGVASELRRRSIAGAARD